MFANPYLLDNRITKKSFFVGESPPLSEGLFPDRMWRKTDVLAKSLTGLETTRTQNEQLQ